MFISIELPIDITSFRWILVCNQHVRNLSVNHLALIYEAIIYKLGFIMTIVALQ